MKVSVSLRDEDVEFLDTYVKSKGMPSRSSGVTRAIRALQVSELAQSYEDAWEEWGEESEAIWISTIDDGLSA